MRIVLTEFARPRLFPRIPRPNTIRDITPEAFERHLNEHAPAAVLPGYAPFCVLHVHRNWTSTRCLTAPVTDANRHLMRNALGVAEGGSGVPLDAAAYRRSVAFWSANANWR